MTPNIENGFLNDESINHGSMNHKSMNKDYYIDENISAPDEIVIIQNPYYFTPVKQIHSRPILEPPKLVRQHGKNPLKVYRQNNQIVWVSMRQPMF